LGLGTVPSGRRLGEYLTRMGETQLLSLQTIARHLARQVAPTILEHQVETLGPWAASSGSASVFVPRSRRTAMSSFASASRGTSPR